MILCCGEALIDMLPGETSQGEACLVPKPGGAVFNTAIALGRLGADVALFTGISDDLFGRQLEQELAASNVSQNALVRMNAPTSLAFVDLQDGDASYTFYTNGAADNSLIPADGPKDLSVYDAAFFGGISLCTDPTATTLQTLMHRLKAVGCLTMIDPNIRPSFIQDEKAYRARLSDMMRVADVVKVSIEDLTWLVPDGETASEKISMASLNQDTLVLVTNGAKGASAFDGQGALKRDVPSRRVNVVDTVGAGDTFNAGVLFKFDGRKPSSHDLASAIAFANACAAVTVSRRGANPPTLAEVGGKA